MIRSLRFRLIVITAAIPLIAIGGVALLASRAAAAGFDQLIAGTSVSAPSKNVVRYIRTDGLSNDPERSAIAWAGAPATAGAAEPSAIQTGAKAISIAMVADKCLISIPGSGTNGGSFDAVFTAPVGASVPAIEGPMAERLAELPQSGTVLSGDGTEFSIFGVKPFAAVYQGDQQAFLDGVNRNLLIGGIAAALVSTLFAAWSGRRLTRPLEALTTAAERLGAGDLKQRVNVGSRDEVGKLGSAFNAMAESLESGEQLRRSMTSDIAHELRTPLHSLAGYLDAVADGVVEPDDALFQTLQEESAVLIRLVADLEQLSLAEAGRLTLRRRTVDPTNVVRRCVEVAKPRAAAHGVMLTGDVPESLPEVEVDLERLSQVLRNLIENAITHTPHGGRVDVAADSTVDDIRVTVRDTGSGIAPEHLPFIFERFYRADSSRTRATGGAGLGLAIVQQLVQAHGGRVEVESEAGVGSTFRVVLPRAGSRDLSATAAF